MSQRRIESFLLRIVIDESPDCKRGEWRGRVHHISSGTESYFETMNDLITIIDSQITNVELPAEGAPSVLRQATLND